jgi:hypothetical protein
MPRRYGYVGPEDIRQRVKREAHCIRVGAPSDVIPWTADFLPPRKTRGTVFATFVIDPDEQLWIADRRSEHVACANGKDVLAAGEIIFDRASDQIEVIEITNQSTGYCPEPECWMVVEAVLNRIGIRHQGCFTTVFQFRRCSQCGTTTIVKDEIFQCAVCDTPLSRDWNYS